MPGRFADFLNKDIWHDQQCNIVSTTNYRQQIWMLMILAQFSVLQSWFSKNLCVECWSSYSIFLVRSFLHSEHFLQKWSEKKGGIFCFQKIISVDLKQWGFWNSGSKLDKPVIGPKYLIFGLLQCLQLGTLSAVNTKINIFFAIWTGIILTNTFCNSDKYNFSFSLTMSATGRCHLLCE